MVLELNVHQGNNKLNIKTEASITVKSSQITELFILMY